MSDDKCARCASTRILYAGGKVSDMSFGNVGERKWDGYVPRDLGIGGGDYLEIAICLDCGQAEGEWPLPVSELESA